MSSKHLALKLLALILLAAVLAGCTTTTPTAAPAPTSAPQPTATAQPTVNLQPTFSAVQTQAVKDAMAALTQNAPTAAPTKPAATATAAATAAPTAAPTATATTVAGAIATKLAPTATLAPTAVKVTPSVQEYSCYVVSASPLASDGFAPGADLDATWEVINTGLAVWSNSEVDLRFVDGVKMEKMLTLPKLTTSVARNEHYTFILDLKAPLDYGLYTATYAVMHGGQTMCTLNLSVRVK